MLRTTKCSRRQFLAASLAAGTVCPWLTAAEPPARSADVPWLDEVQTPPPRLPADALRLEPLLVDSQGRSLATLEAWKEQRARVRQWWCDFLGPLRAERRGPPSLRVVSEDRPDGVVRQLIEYETEPGVAVAAYLLKPAQRGPRRPGVVVLHSTTQATIRQPAGLATEPSKAFGLTLARRGYVTLCPRCFLWSDDLSIRYDEHVRRFQQRHPQARGMAKMLHDALVAVDVLAAQPDVDPQRLGAVGHSLGGKEVLYVAAFDERVRAAVSSEGGVGTRFSNWEAPWYLGPAIRGADFRHEHHELVALAAPRAFLLLGGDSADGDRSWPFIDAALPVYRLYGGRPRLGLFNHKQGHSVPPEAEQRVYAWFEAYC
jgi:dienelactone hydrolase